MNWSSIPASVAVLVALSLLLLAGPSVEQAGAQTTPQPTLTGETLVAEELFLQQTDTPIEVTANCDNPDGTATIDYTVEGVAAGPYPGTFTESGTFTLGPPVPGTGSPILQREVESFSATFSIDSSAGQVEGTKSAQDLPLATARGVCGETSDPPAMTFIALAEVTQARYEARIAAPAGTFRDRGGTAVLIQDIEETTPGGTTYFESFTESFNSDLTEAEPLLPASKDECKKGGFEDFGFENQGECVSSVVGRGSHGKG